MNGDDRLVGSPYGDHLDSGTGSDTVTGGAGLDTFADASCAYDATTCLERDTLIETGDFDTAIRCGALACLTEGDWEAAPTRDDLASLDPGHLDPVSR